MAEVAELPIAAPGDRHATFGRDLLDRLVQAPVGGDIVPVDPPVRAQDGHVDGPAADMAAVARAGHDPARRAAPLRVEPVLLGLGPLALHDPEPDVRTLRGLRHDLCERGVDADQLGLRRRVQRIERQGVAPLMRVAVLQVLRPLRQPPLVLDRVDPVRPPPARPEQLPSPGEAAAEACPERRARADLQRVVRLGHALQLVGHAVLPAREDQRVGRADRALGRGHAAHRHARAGAEGQRGDHQPVGQRADDRARDPGEAQAPVGVDHRLSLVELRLPPPRDLRLEGVHRVGHVAVGVGVALPLPRDVAERRTQDVPARRLRRHPVAPGRQAEGLLCHVQQRARRARRLALQVGQAVEHLLDHVLLEPPAPVVDVTLDLRLLGARAHNLQPARHVEAQRRQGLGLAQ